jgi:signal transduction histidine kinase
LVTTFVGVLVFPAFQRFVERRLLGVRMPAQSMVESYSTRIVTSNTLSALLKLLEEEVFPSLLIRQYAFLRMTNLSAEVFLARDADLDSISEQALLDLLASSSTGHLLPAARDEQPFGWVHLALPLRVGPDLIGAWLLGRRDPDDHYPQAELPVLQSLANQTAIALSNTLQTERLKVMYEANLHRYEEERSRLGRDLHDSVLNEMGAMLMKQDPADLPPGFQQSFDDLIARLREIVTDLRPPLLLYGLKYALDGLADNLSDRSHDVVQVISEIQSPDGYRYPETVEHNIYRIVQEACENALKYAHAKAIRIHGELASGKIDLHVVDDGIGFKDDVSLLLDEMVANKHFGLAGMHERADLIGAAIKIDSKANQGIHIQVMWEAKDSM